MLMLRRPNAAGDGERPPARVYVIATFGRAAAVLGAGACRKGTSPQLDVLSSTSRGILKSTQQQGI